MKITHTASRDEWLAARLEWPPTVPTGKASASSSKMAARYFTPIRSTVSVLMSCSAPTGSWI